MDICEWEECPPPKREKVEARYVGHCGKIFRDFEVCGEPKIDDLCFGCPYNDEGEENQRR